MGLIVLTLSDAKIPKFIWFNVALLCAPPVLWFCFECFCKMDWAILFLQKHSEQNVFSPSLECSNYGCCHVYFEAIVNLDYLFGFRNSQIYRLEQYCQISGGIVQLPNDVANKNLAFILSCAILLRLCKFLHCSSFL